MNVLQAEVSFLGQLHHPNLVKLIGYCIEDDQRLLVYEFMTRGSLENHLFRSKWDPLRPLHSLFFFHSFVLFHHCFFFQASHFTFKLAIMTCEDVVWTLLLEQQQYFSTLPTFLRNYKIDFYLHFMFFFPVHSSLVAFCTNGG